MKFILLVEGQTERDSAAGLLKRWLDPRLRQPIGITPVAFKGYADFASNLATKVRMHLEGPKRSEIVGMIGLLDLYGPPYPSDKTTVEERYQWGKQHFEKKVNSAKFRMAYAVHEFEAWLLSQPDIFPREVRDAFPEKIKHPERVNFQAPPAKLLGQVYQQTHKGDYKKTTYGKQLFAKLDPEVAASKCPYLLTLLNEMLALAQAAGLR